MPHVDIATKLFDAMVKPITLYGCDVWGTETTPSIQSYFMKGKIDSVDKYLRYINNCPHEQLHLKFCKMLLGLRKNTPNLAVRAELGRFPLTIEIYMSLIKYWIRLINLPTKRIMVDALNSNINTQCRTIFMGHHDQIYFRIHRFP